MDQGNHPIAQCRKNLWGLARPDVRLVFLKGDITDLLEPILNPPVTPDELEEAIRAGVHWWQIRDERDHFFAVFLGGGDAPLQLRHWCQPWPTRKTRHSCWWSL
jgi:hypothetical protein